MNARVSPEQLQHDDEDCNRSTNPSFNDILDARLSRRGSLQLALGSAATAVLGSVAFPAAATPAHARAGANAQPLALDFQAVAKSLADTVVVPQGYTARVLYALGDPLDMQTPDFRNDGTDTGFDRRAGDHHDGMEYFGLNASGTSRDPDGTQRAILAMNHEALTDQFLHADGVSARPRPAAEADKEIPAHGLSFVEIARTGSTYAYERSSRYNRRVTPMTPVQIHGPLRANALMRTAFSPDGTQARGTINNCGTGITPWGTYLSGEENWAGYFFRNATDDAARTSAGMARSNASLNRYGKPQNSASRHGWETAGSADAYARWDISVVPGKPADGSGDYRNELNTFGWIIEVDPYDPSQAVRKRTALGRFAHESAAFGIPRPGQPLAVYMGDDSRGEYVYKFVSTERWRASDGHPQHRASTGDKYLDSGKLYVAKYNGDGSGTWVELTIANPLIATLSGYRFADQADVLANARLAADAVGATKMDRPEWGAVHPVTGEVYMTMTNNTSRRVQPSGASQMAPDAANPRVYTDGSSTGNVNGHIIRMREDGDDNGALGFLWDVYLFGAEFGADPARVNLSGLTADQDMSSPDGLWFSRRSGACFIQTDDGAYTDVTNCMMLVGLPGHVGDGSDKTLEYTRTDGSKLAVTTRIGARPTPDTLRRFMVGPRDCEITGICESPDGKAIFVNVQHPGEAISKTNVGNPAAYASHWPGNAGYGAGGALARPRSATVVITRDDGGVIGVSGKHLLGR